MGWDTSIIIPVFTDILARRPQNVLLSSTGAIPVPAGGNANFACHGEFLEGDITLYSDSNRISFQDIQHSGEFENTQLNAIINATTGANQDNINVWGYTFGQDGNETAKFNLNNAISIQDVEPQVDDFQTSFINLAYPEMQKYVVSASENVHSILLTADGQTVSYPGKEFVYTFKKSGYQVISVQGKTIDGRLSNIVSKPIDIPQRPHLNEVTIRPKWESYSYGDQMVPFQLTYLGIRGSSISGTGVPFWYVRASQNDWVYLRGALSWVLGWWNYPISQMEAYAMWGNDSHGGNYQYSLAGIDVNTLDISIYAPYDSSTFRYGDLSIFIRGLNQVGCWGPWNEIVIEIIPYPGFSITENPASPGSIQWYPSTNLMWYAPSVSTSMYDCYGNIGSYNQAIMALSSVLN